MLSPVPSSFAANPYGLTNRVPIGPFLNTNLPPSVSVNTGTFTVVNAFPNLTFDDPTFLTYEPGTNRLVVCGRQGTIWSFTNDPNTTNKVVFLSLTNRCQGYDDCGLLGMAFHPQFGQAGSTNRGYFYVYYQYTPIPTNPNGNRLIWTIPTYNRLSRFNVPDGSLVADPNSEVVLVNQFDQHVWHNGGGMFFGNDGFLYWSSGDEGDTDNFYGVAQKINESLFSGVLRIDVNQDPTKSHPIIRQPVSGTNPPSGWPRTYTTNYYIPNDNPFVNTNGSVLEEFYAIGFRSPHRMTIDRPTGTVWLGDVGDSSREEVDIIIKGGNYQWAYEEGYNFAGPNAKPAPLIGIDSPPIYDYPHANANSCVIGGYVYRGTQFASELGGLYIFGDDYSGRIWTLTNSTGSYPATVNYLCNMPPGAGYSGGLSSFGMDQSNELYMCTMGIGTGAIWKFAHTSGPQVAPPPPLLSEVGAFTNLATLAAAPGLVPYNVNCPLWSDGAIKTRWLAIPSTNNPFTTSTQINFAPTGEWSFPIGTVFIKHFELQTNDNNPSATKRLETRVLVASTNGAYYGLTYKWRPDYSDADLLTNSLSEDVLIATTNGGTRTQTWYYPSQQDCLVCHNPNANYVMGVKTRQLNGNFTYPSTGVTDNQLRTLNKLGLFNPSLNETNIPTYSALTSVTNTGASLDTRVRSYIDANCAQCHRPNSGIQANFDARFDTPLANQAIINGVLADNLGIQGAAVMVPSDPSSSIMYLRMNTVGTNQMPPIARNLIDSNAVATVAAWINSYVYPYITQQPASQSVFVGNSVNFQVAAGGTGPFSYQWQYNGQNVFGATNNIFSIPTVQDTDSGTYSVIVSSIAGVVTSSNAVLTVNGPPNILAQPQSQSTVIGQPVSFSVNCSGTTPLSYQWEFNSAVIPGATNSVFSLLSPQLSDSGTYSVFITNVLGSALSSNATLVVTPPSATNWLDQDIGSVTPSGSFGLTNGLFTISASGDDIYGTNDAFHFVYQTITGDGAVVARVVQLEHTADWAKGGVMIRESLDPGAKNAFMAISYTNGATYQYRTATGGATANFSGPGVGAPYWVKLVRSGTSFSGFVSSDGLSWALVGNVSITMSNTVYFGLALTAHNDGVLNTSTFDNMQFVGQVLQQPLSQDVQSGTNVTFTGLVFGAPLYYQWQFNGSNIAGAESTTFTVTNVQQFNAGNYALLGTNLAGTTTTSNAVLTVDAPVTINTQPQSQNVNQGTMVTFSVSATGSGTLTYQWQLGGNPISGATASSFSINSAQPTDAGAYSVVVSSPAGSVTSAAAILTVNGLPIINSQPQNQNVTVGTPAAFSVSATGATPLSYQWEYNATIIPGATNSAFSLPSAQLTDSGNYSVLLSNAFGTVLSSNAVLSVTPPSSTNWLDTDIGSTTPAGSFAVTNGVFTVNASGDDIWGTADDFHFVYQQITGDGAIVARVVQIENTAAWAKGGVMFRESLAAGSKNALMAISYTNGASYQYRTASNGSSANTSGPSVGAPYWVKLVRSGTNFSGYVSSNGLAWSLVGSAGISMSNTIYFGVALTAHNNGVLNTSTFDNVQFIGSMLQQPQNLTLNQGASGSFFEVAFGSPLTPQWRFNGTNIAGALSTSYTVANAQPSQAGNYSVVLTNLAGTLVSSNALLTVNVQQVTISTQPQSQTINQGNSATFTVAASGPPPLTYQWSLNSNPISGATNTSYTVNNAQPTNAGTYNVTVYSPAGNVTSSNAVLVVNVPPSISTQPLSQAVTQGSSVTFRVSATGTSPLSYQWQSSSGPIAGATASAFTIVNAQPVNADTYSVVITNVAGSITSSNASLTVNVPPGISFQPVSQTVIAGSNVTFTVNATGTAPLSYQWRSSSGPIAGATASAFTIVNAQPVNADTYSVVITNVAGSITSSNASLTVNVPPGISVQPVSQTVIAGSNATFTVTASGTSPLSYQWRSSSGPITGATASAFTIVNAQPVNADTYSVVITNVAGSITSSNASLTVNVPPGISVQPVSQTVIAGSNVTFTVTASGTAPLSYQWRSSSGPIAGATASAFTIVNAQPANADVYSVVITNIAGTITSSNASLTVNVPPGISVQPVSQTVLAGSNVTFSVVATGTAPLSYQWRSSSGPIAGATASAFTIVNAQPANADVYSVVITNVAGSITSSNASLTVNVPPGISVQPVSQTVLAGSNVTFSVIATGTTPLSYQWQSSSGPIAGATASAFTIVNAQPANADTYSVVITNIAGTITSSNASLTVNVPPGISVQPLSQTVIAGSNATFTVTASGTAPLSYQWRSSSGPITGATASAFTIVNAQPVNADTYSVVITNVAGSITSSNASLTVNVPPGISVQPLSQTAIAGSNVTFTVNATGTAPLSYQWGSSSGPIAGATASTFTIVNAQPANADVYSVVITNIAGTITSSNASLTVNVPPGISVQPLSQTVIAGSNVTFTVNATGTAPLSYQWRSSSGPIAGATANAFTIVNAQPANADTYSVVITNIAGSITSSNASLTVNVPPGISVQPLSQTVIAGSNVTFSVTATGTTPLSYQWQSSSGPVAGATASAFTIVNAQPTNADTYSVVITNVAGSITSSNASLTVNVPPGISVQPVSQTVIAGSNVTFSVTATGTTPLSYQWQSSSGPVSGATNSSYCRTNVQPADAGNYSVVITNVAGSITSSNALLTVNVAPSISTQPQGQFVAAGSNVTFSVTASGTAPLAYQWLLNGTNIAGANASFYLRTNVQPPDAGGYSVVVTNVAGSATSATASLVINTAPVLAPISNQVIVAGQTLTITNVATDADVPTNILTFGITTNAPAGAAIDPNSGVFTWTPTQAQAPSTNLITVFVYDNGIPSLTNSQSFTVVVNQMNLPPVLNPISNRTIHAQTTLAFTATATDPNIPTNTLTFSLATNSPTGATINPGSGAFLWTPTDGQVGTNNFTVTVTDDGIPPLSDSQSFVVTVVSRPQITSVVRATNGSVSLNWTSIPGQGYQLQYKLNLTDASWLAVSNSVTAVTNIAGYVDSPGADIQRFYRVLVLP